MKKNKKKPIVWLLLLFAIMMSTPWLVPHTGWLALFGFIPLLCADRLADEYRIKSFFWSYFAAFVLWNAFTTFWVCNATVGGGIFAIVGNAFQMSMVFALFRISKRRFHGALPYVFLAVAWISWERLYFSAEISWPWLTLGYAFARTPYLAQWYSVTGVLGGSLWIWIVNLSVFALMVMLSDGSWYLKRQKSQMTIFFSILFFIFAPVAASLVMNRVVPERSEGSLTAVIAQPNFDPYQKFESLTQADQTSITLKGIQKESNMHGTPDLYVAPETFTSDVWLNDIQNGATFCSIKDFLQDKPESDFIFGASTSRFYAKKASPHPLAYQVGSGWITSHNSALITNSQGREEFCNKGKLVAGTELTPYPELFLKFERFLSEKFGIQAYSGRCVGPEKPLVLHLSDGTPVGCAICYESVFGEYCAEYVKQGAKVLAVITNDAWWGNSPGYIQHLSYSCIRAIELRRDIVRSANTGISAFIDQKGRIVSQTQWWKESYLRGKLNLNSRMTIFAQYGDITGKACMLAFILLSLAFVVRLFTRKG